MQQIIKLFQFHANLILKLKAISLLNSLLGLSQKVFIALLLGS